MNFEAEIVVSVNSVSEKDEINKDFEVMTVKLLRNRVPVTVCLMTMDALPYSL